MTELCGRPTAKGTPCRVSRPFRYMHDGHAPACRRHMTTAERAEHVADCAKWNEMIARHATALTAVPACWTWPVTDDDQQCAAETQWVGHWQNGRCGVCGGKSEGLLDHDHRTGWVRGLTCRSCNVREAHSDSRLFRLYRKRNPAGILGIWRRYCHPIYGMDWGTANGRRTWRPWLVDGCGVTYCDHAAQSIRDDPAHLVAAATIPDTKVTRARPGRMKP